MAGSENRESWTRSRCMVYHTERVHPRQKIRPPLRVSARGRRRRAGPPRGAAPPGSLTRSGGVPLECLGARAAQENQTDPEHDNTATPRS